MAARTVTAFIRATLGERDLSVGIVSSIQTHGSLVNWHPHFHMLVTDGGFRSDGTFVRLPLHDVTTLTEAFRRAVLALFVKRELMDVETAQGIQIWRAEIPFRRIEIRFRRCEIRFGRDEIRFGRGTGGSAICR